MRGIRLCLFTVISCAFAWLFTACENKDPSVLKIFVRSSSNQLMEGAQVVVIGDPSSNPPTQSYVDTAYTNTSGYASFSMDPYFTKAGEGNDVGYFDVIAKDSVKTGNAYARCRAHITTVETIYLK
jgi:hypothetical protein